jgi:hypothetical protein
VKSFYRLLTRTLGACDRADEFTGLFWESARHATWEDFCWLWQRIRTTKPFTNKVHAEDRAYLQAVLDTLRRVQVTEQRWNGLRWEPYPRHLTSEEKKSALFQVGDNDRGHSKGYRNPGIVIRRILGVK